MISKGDSLAKDSGWSASIRLPRVTTKHVLSIHAVPSTCSTQERIDFQCVKGFAPGVHWVIRYIHNSTSSDFPCAMYFWGASERGKMSPS